MDSAQGGKDAGAGPFFLGMAPLTPGYLAGNSRTPRRRNSVKGLKFGTSGLRIKFGRCMNHPEHFVRNACGNDVAATWVNQMFRATELDHADKRAKGVRMIPNYALKRFIPCGIISGA